MRRLSKEVGNNRRLGRGRGFQFGLKGPLSFFLVHFTRRGTNLSPSPQIVILLFLAKTRTAEKELGEAAASWCRKEEREAAAGLLSPCPTPKSFPPFLSPLPLFPLASFCETGFGMESKRGGGESRDVISPFALFLSFFLRHRRRRRRAGFSA